MNRIMGRAKMLLLLILALAIGTGSFVFEYLTKAGDWVLSPGSPHIYQSGNIGCGTVADRDGILLLDLKDDREYASNLLLRQSIIHWLGDRQGNISAPALPHYASFIAGHDLFNGVYAYGGTGGIVNMSLSAKLQIAAMEAIGDYKGTLAIYNYKTGEILCAVTTPNYDPDNVPDFSANNSGAYDGVYVNRFTQSTYIPGSIFKVVTIAAVLEGKPEIQEMTFECTGIVEYGIDKVTCERKHGKLSFRDAFAQSCNCAFAAIANALGGDTLEQYAKQFGVLDSISFDGIKTAAGNLEAAGKADVLVAWSAIGQHMDQVNPCAYLTFIGAIANDGIALQPHIVNSVKVGNSVTYDASVKERGRIMSASTAKAMQSYLRYNVTSYYGADIFPENMTVCAKSGTAQVGGEKKPNACFTGFLTDPEYPLAFIAIMEDGGYGRQICVPILNQVLEECKEVLKN